MSSLHLGDEWTAGLVQHQGLLSKQGRAPGEQQTWAPGSSMGLPLCLHWKKSLVGIEVRLHLRLCRVSVT